MMTKILGVVKNAVQNYGMTSTLGSKDALVTMLAADIYRSMIAHENANKPQPQRKPAQTQG